MSDATAIRKDVEAAGCKDDLLAACDDIAELMDERGQHHVAEELRSWDLDPEPMATGNDQVDELAYDEWVENGQRDLLEALDILG